MRFVLTMLCGFCLCWSLQAKTYVIGIEQLDYYPHYDFKSAQPRGYFFDLMQLYSQWSGDKFVFKALPVKRLYKDSVELTDFVYPDNKAWQPHLGVDEQITKYYSAPVIYTLGATMVLPHKQQMRLSEFKVLANILINLSFNWAMSWIGLSRQFEGEALSQQQHQFTEQTIIQVQLLFRGISHWERPSITMPETAALKNPL